MHDVCICGSGVSEDNFTGFVLAPSCGSWELNYGSRVPLPTEPPHLPQAAHPFCSQATPTGAVISAVGHLSLPKEPTVTNGGLCLQQALGAYLWS